MNNFLSVIKKLKRDEAIAIVEQFYNDFPLLIELLYKQIKQTNIWAKKPKHAKVNKLF